MQAAPHATPGITPRTATAEQAMGWIKGGWELFVQAPGIWIAILVIYLLISFAFSVIPVVGSLALSLFAPVFTLGWLQGARDLQAGRALRITHLFHGFQSPRMGNLVLLGLLSLGIGIGFTLVAALGAFGVASGSETNEGPGLGALLLILLILLAILALLAAFLFATPLVGFAGLSPLDALIVGLIPFGLGLLIVGPLLTASYWLMCRDVFELPPESPTASEPTL
jgi:hypothetical protein